MTEQKFPQIHQSHIETLLGCGERFKRLYLDGEKEPKTIPLLVGISSHRAIAADLNNKKDKGSLLCKGELQDKAKDIFKEEIGSNEVMLQDGESKGKAQDQTIDLVSAYHYDVAPIVQPIGIEEKFLLNLPEIKWSLAGTIDVNEEKALRDTKTTKINTGQIVVDKSFQYTYYSYFRFRKSNNTFIPKIYQDTVIKPTKTQPARCITYSSTRTQVDFICGIRRLLIAVEYINAGIFIPAKTNDPLCDPRYCGFYKTCPYVNSERILSAYDHIKKSKEVKKPKEELLNGLLNSLKGEKQHV